MRLLVSQLLIVLLLAMSIESAMGSTAVDHSHDSDYSHQTDGDDQPSTDSDDNSDHCRHGCHGHTSCPTGQLSAADGGEPEPAFSMGARHLIKLAQAPPTPPPNRY